MSLPACLDPNWHTADPSWEKPKRCAEVIVHGVGAWKDATAVRVYLLQNVVQAMLGDIPTQDVPARKRIWIDRNIMALLNRMPQVCVTVLREADEVPR